MSRLHVQHQPTLEATAVPEQCSLEGMTICSVISEIRQSRRFHCVAPAAELKNWEQKTHLCLAI